MTTSLNTELFTGGVRLTFEGGRSAGVITYDPDTYTYHFHAPHHPDAYGPKRNCLEAAQFDALAWAAEINQRAAQQSI